MILQLVPAASGRHQVQSSRGSLCDKELDPRIRAGDGSSLVLIMRRYNFRVVRGILRHGNIAEDVVQGSYERAVEHLGRETARLT